MADIKLLGKFIELDGQPFFLCPPSDEIGIILASEDGTEKATRTNQVWADISQEIQNGGLDENMDWFWCQERGEPILDEPSLRCVVRKYKPFVSTADEDDCDVGWRPMLIPLTSEKKFYPYVFGGMPNGTTIKMYTLMLGDATVRADVDDPEFYMGGSQIKITDEFFADNTLINWIICDGTAIADRNLLSNISWSELSKQGLFKDTIEIDLRLPLVLHLKQYILKM